MGDYSDFEFVFQNGLCGLWKKSVVFLKFYDSQTSKDFQMSHAKLT